LINELVVFSVVAGIIFLGFGGEIFFKRTGISYFLFLIFVGILLGPIFHIFPREPLIPVLGLFSSFTLIMVLFYSGMDMKIREVIRGSPRTLLQVSIYVVVSIFAIGLFGRFVLNWDLAQSLMFGCMIGGETTAAVVVPLTRSLSLQEKTVTFLTLESLVNSILSIVFFVAFLDLYKHGTTSWIVPIQSITENFLVGIAIGLALSISWLFVLRYLRGLKYKYVFTLGLLFATYSITQVLNGNGLIAVLIFGLLLGNEKSVLLRLRQKFTISDMSGQFKEFQSEMSFLMETFFFVFLGLTFIIVPSTILYNLAIASVFFAILLVIRYFATRVSTKGSELEKDKKIIFLICAMGIVPATLSIVGLNEGLPLANTFVSLVVYVIILTNIITTVGVLFVSRKAKDLTEKKK